MYRERRVLATVGLALVALVLTACPSGSISSSASPSAGKVQISAGTNVSVQPIDPATGKKPATLTFGSVTTPGDVGITTSTTGPALPAGFTLASGTTYFDITTTAKFDKATLCLEDPNVSSKSKLYHYTNNTWNDRTTTVTPPQICGDFTSFSPVVIVESTTSAASPTPTPTATAAATATATAAATATATASAAATPSAAASSAAPQATDTPPPSVAAATTPPPTTPPPTTPPPTPTPTPTPVVVANAPPCPATGLAICGTVTDAGTGSPIPQACITLGPPIRCFTTTGGDGKYVINLSDLAATPGTTWDLYALRTTVEPKYGQSYSGKFVVSAVVVKNFALTKQ